MWLQLGPALAVMWLQQGPALRRQVAQLMPGMLCRHAAAADAGRVALGASSVAVAVVEWLASHVGASSVAVTVAVDVDVMELGACGGGSATPLAAHPLPTP